MTYLIGEALTGSGDELAHIDLCIGDKEGSVGQAFAEALANPTAGHTPLLAVIRPNLPPKPHTLVVPKVTVKDMDDAGKIFGPAQAAVAKAVADTVEEGIIPKAKLDEWVIICGVFIHPKAKDYSKIYQYNYTATKLALKRAMQNYPPLEKILYEKDRAKHPIMGFRRPRLWRPPYLQIALDIPSITAVERLMKQLPESDRLIFEAGTPLIKKYGVSVVNKIRELKRDAFIVADLKTMDVAKVEVDLAFEESADAVSVLGTAAIPTIDNAIYEADRMGIYSILDTMNIEDPVALIEALKEPPKIILLHRSVDVERAGGEAVDRRWEFCKTLKAKYKQLLVAVAGGLRPDNVSEALKQGTDIIVVGRYITQSKDVRLSVEEFLEQFKEREIDLFREHIE